MFKQKTIIFIGVLLGMLVGFVFGAAYGRPDTEAIKTSNAGSGNVSKLTGFRYGASKAEPAETPARDTLSYTLVDSEGQSWNIMMTKK